MFVREELRLTAAFGAAQDRLADLVQSGSLLTAAQAASDEGAAVAAVGTAPEDGLARVGPVGPVRGLSRVVRVRLGDLATRDDTVQLPLRWEAIGRGGGLFPVLDADIRLDRVDHHATVLTLTGVYRPPLGSVGAGLDQAVLHRLAAATIRDFVSRIAAAIASAEAAAGSSASASRGPSRPSAAD